MIASCVGTESDAHYWAHFRPGNHELRCSLLTPLAELFPVGDANALAPQPPTYKHWRDGPPEAKIRGPEGEKRGLEVLPEMFFHR